jgi:hypothetical protein
MIAVIDISEWMLVTNDDIFSVVKHSITLHPFSANVALLLVTASTA